MGIVWCPITADTSVEILARLIFEGTHVTHELIYDGNAQVGVRIFDKAAEVDPFLRSLESDPISQMVSG